MSSSSSNHGITVTSNPRQVRVLLGGQVVAETTRALTLREGSMSPVQYIAREDAAMALYRRTSHASRCPFKGEASYYTVAAGGRTAENAAWSYEAPLPAMTAIAGHLAFYPNRVDAIEELPD